MKKREKIMVMSKKEQDYLSKVDINDIFKLTSNEKSLVVLHQEDYYPEFLFFILSLGDKDEIVAKSINIEEAKKIVAYLNAHIILAEND